MGLIMKTPTPFFPHPTRLRGPSAPWSLVASLLAAVSLLGAEPAKESLDPHLELLRPFIGKTFRGELKGSTKEKPIIDISHYERALNGTAVRSLHSINNGAYGGESLIFWDKSKEQIVYYYFTTAGFFTTGVMKLESAGKYVSTEKVTGSADGVTEVRATGEIKADGTFVTSSEYLKDGKWVPGHSAVYKETPDAEVKFK